MNPKVNILLITFVLVLSGLSSSLLSQVAVLQPGSVQTQSDYDTLSWRTLSEPTVNFWNEAIGQGDSIAVWFRPEDQCSLIAFRVLSYDFEGTGIANVWDGSRYDGHITTTDSTDSNGWIGDFVDNQWIPGTVMGHSPIGWSMDDRDQHYWGPFPFTITSQLSGEWYEIPTRFGLQGEVPVGDKPFFITVTFYTTFGLGWAAEDEGTVPYHSFRYYNYADGHGSPGPDGHFGWFIHSSSVWIEAIVKYYEPLSLVEDDTDSETPSTFFLAQNYPNPFNAATRINFQMTNEGRVELNVYNILGHHVRTLSKGQHGPGQYNVTWDGKDDFGGDVSSGIYVYKLTVNGTPRSSQEDFINTRKMILVR